ncbi:MAG: lysophospholipid acyltransferase family protein [Chloroflexota bacterium]
MTMVRKTVEQPEKDFIPVPRRTLYRRLWRFGLRTAALFFIDAKISGRQHFPTEGPVILVANHNAFIEIGMLQAYAPYPIEFLTTGDIPLEPRFALLAQIYGYIPVKRGSMDRSAMNKALSVLQQGGVVGLFPQGGIWETTVTQAHTGVAWLSQKSGAPIVPVGFGGTEGSITRASRFQRPAVTMNVGQPIPATPEKVAGKSRKDVLEDSTAEVMQAVFDLIPQWEKDSWRKLAAEEFTLELNLMNGVGHSANGSTPNVTNAAEVSKFFHRPVLLDAMRRNLGLDVGVLEQVRTERDAAALAAALDEVLTYTTETNPYFLTYRFGNDEGHAMEAGLAELRDAARWAAENGYSLSIKPVRRFRMEGEADFTVEEYPKPIQQL